MKQIIYTLTILSVVVFSVWLLKEKMVAEKRMGSFELKQQKALYKAIKSNDVTKVKELAPSTELNIRNSKKHSLLYAAVHQVTSRMFWEEKMKSDKKINEKSAEIIKILIENGADPCLVDGNYQYASVISTAIKAETPDQVFDAILAGGFDPNSPIGSWKNPIIFELISQEQFSKLKLLVERYGAKVNYFLPPKGEGRQKTPILIAARSATPEIVLYLIEHGADPKQKDLAYEVFRTIVRKADWIEKHGSKQADSLQKVERELIENLNLKEFLIQKGISWPPKVSEQFKERNNWATDYLEDIAIEKRAAQKYTNRLNREQ